MSEPPQFSPDGKWRWDGAKWVPASEAPPEAPAWQVVQTEGGPVSVAPLAGLQARITALNQWAAGVHGRAEELLAQADRTFGSAGDILVSQSGEWSTPPDLQQVVSQAAQLAQRVAADTRQEEALKSEEASVGLFQKVRAHRHEHQVERDEAQAQAQLEPLVIRVGRSAPTTNIAEAERLRSEGATLDAQRADLMHRADAAIAEAAAIGQEVGRRQDAINQIGFDTLYEAALLQTSGPQPVDSPLVLRAAEAAYQAEPATLARMRTSTRYVGGSSGFSFPIGHTGIRYRVGRFHGHPVQQESLSHLDTGTLVLTNQRLAYVGATKSIAIPLAKVLHVEVYNDGISVAHEGKENADFFLISNPKQFVFMLNWFLGKVA